MRSIARHGFIPILLALAVAACEHATAPTGDSSDNGAGGNGGGGPLPITTFTSPATGGCPTARPKSVLVDPTHDGGVWWYPQAASTPAGFNPDSLHQGRRLANYLRSLGYTVTELGRGATLPTDSMRLYATVIRAGYYYDVQHPGYSTADLNAYAAYLACPRTLLLLGEYLRPGLHDVLADSLGIPLTGMIRDTITDFTAHELTAGVTSLDYVMGSYLAPGYRKDVQVLARLHGGEGVMGVLAAGPSKVFFIGDMNGIESVPQPLTKNLVAWGFK